MSGAPAARRGPPVSGLAYGRPLEHARTALPHGTADRVAEALALGLLGVTLLYALVGFEPFQHTVVSYGADTSTVNRWVWLALLIAALPVLWLRREQALRLLLALWPLLLLYAWFALSAAWALDPPVSVRRFLFFAVALTVFLAIGAGIRHARAGHLVLLLGSGAVVLVDVGSGILAPGLAMTPLGLAGLHAQKNTAGEIGLYAVLAAATFVPLARGRAGRAGSIALTLMAGALLMLARSATSTSLAIATLLGLPLLVALLRRPPLTAWVLAALGAAMLGGVLFLYLAWAGIEGRDPLAPLASVTFTRRTDVWNFVLSEVAKRPMLGAGFASFWDIDPNIQPSLYKGFWFASPTEYTNESHNGYLDILVATGWIGLILALAVLGRAIWLALREAARAPAAALPTVSFHLAFLLALAVHNLMESTYFMPNTAFGTLFLFSAVQLESWRLGRSPVARLR